MPNFPRLALVGVLGFGLAACGSDSGDDVSDSAGESATPSSSQSVTTSASPTSSSEPAECEDAAGILEAIAEGFTEDALTVSDGSAVSITVPGDSPVFSNLKYVVAAEIGGTDDYSDAGDTGLWAVGGLTSSGGPIIAVNELAQETTDWGAAATPGSPADAVRSDIEDSAEAEAVAECAEEIATADLVEATPEATPAATPQPAVAATPKSTPKPTPKPKPKPAPVYYANCSEVKAAGAAPIRRGDPGYSTKLDRDGDGIACET